MRDAKLYYIDDTGFDINIEGGQLEDVAYENQTQDQRAALGATLEKGSIPGDSYFGVDWGALYAKDSALLDIANQVQETVQSVAGGDGTPSNMYNPIFIPSEDGSVKVVVMKSTV